MENYWKRLPTRDEVLDKIYLFIKAFADGELVRAEKLVLVSDFTKMHKDLQLALRGFAFMHMEDEDYNQLPEDLSAAITSPFDIDEFYLLPTFSGNQFEVQEQEQISVQVPFHGQPTPLKMKFIISENDRLYFLKLTGLEQ